MTMVRFEGALMTEGEDLDEKEYSPRGPIWVRPEAVVAFYDHTILLNVNNNNKIRVMEDARRIAMRLNMPMELHFLEKQERKKRKLDR